MSLPKADVPALKPVLFFDLNIAEAQPIFKNKAKAYTKVDVLGGTIRSLDPTLPFDARITSGFDNISVYETAPSVGNLDCTLYLDLGNNNKGIVQYLGVVRFEGETNKVLGKETTNIGFSDGYVTCQPRFEIDGAASSESWVNNHLFVGKGRFHRETDGSLKVQYYFEMGPYEHFPEPGGFRLEDPDTLRLPPQTADTSTETDTSKAADDHGGQTRRSRASGEILALLVAEFNKNSNPNTNVRKEIALRTGMTERSVRIWFQNRRAKARKMEKLHQSNGAARGPQHPRHTSEVYESQSREPSLKDLANHAKVDTEINEKYSLIDCISVSVGPWQRIKSGHLDPDAFKDVPNLSPRIVYKLMATTDLLVMLSKKDHELNYFFSGVFQNEKVLFRIFFPLATVVTCSLLNYRTQKPEQDDVSREATAQLQLQLAAPPKFAVHFLKDLNTGKENHNQWSVCDDFSEGQQVVTAFVGEGGTEIPHILTGTLECLQYLNTFVGTATKLGRPSSFPGPTTEHPILISPSPFNDEPSFAPLQQDDLRLLRIEEPPQLEMFDGHYDDSGTPRNDLLITKPKPEDDKEDFIYLDQGNEWTDNI
ncbi:hypothetical protein KL919_002908 [Ogataea angusta]|nr:hypothetical protein KL943_003226 [Ogataea angusta]KAG7858843.1 hypothetical protein KL919_002908 [Ogataea angusta]